MINVSLGQNFVNLRNFRNNTIKNASHLSTNLSKDTIYLNFKKKISILNKEEIAQYKEIKKLTHSKKPEDRCEAIVLACEKLPPSEEKDNVIFNGVNDRDDRVRWIAVDAAPYVSDANVEKRDTDLIVKPLDDPSTDVRRAAATLIHYIRNHGDVIYAVRNGLHDTDETVVNNVKESVDKIEDTAVKNAAQRIIKSRGYTG